MEPQSARAHVALRQLHSISYDNERPTHVPCQMSSVEAWDQDRHAKAYIDEPSKKDRALFTSVSVPRSIANRTRHSESLLTLLLPFQVWIPRLPSRSGRHSRRSILALPKTLKHNLADKRLFHSGRGIQSNHRSPRHLRRLLSHHFNSLLEHPIPEIYTTTHSPRSLAKTPSNRLSSIMYFVG